MRSVPPAAIANELPSRSGLSPSFIAIVAALFGFGAVAKACAGVAPIASILFLVLFAISLPVGLRRRSRIL